jgi:hypothetical protein
VLSSDRTTEDVRLVTGFVCPDEVDMLATVIPDVGLTCDVKLGVVEILALLLELAEIIVSVAETELLSLAETI